MENKTIILWVKIFFVTSVFVGLFYHHVFSEIECNKRFHLINEEIRCNKKYAIDKSDYIVVKRQINEYLTSQKDSGSLTRFGVYFRDLEEGPIFGINEKEKFIPASLLKLPLMITYFKLAEEDPDILETKLSFSGKSTLNLEQNYRPKINIEPEKIYTIDELIFNMVAYSDNASYEVLIEYLNDTDPKGNLFLETFRELGVIDPTSELDENLTPKMYGSLFRLLYNSSYLSTEYSEKALEILASSDFKEGIVKKLPNTLTVAHKFGERSGLPQNQKELHDCGVVFFPNNPYLICIMLEGYDFSVMADTIGTVSKMVYDEIESRKI